MAYKTVVRLTIRPADNDVYVGQAETWGKKKSKAE